MSQNDNDTFKKFRERIFSWIKGWFEKEHNYLLVGPAYAGKTELRFALKDMAESGGKAHDNHSRSTTSSCHGDKSFIHLGGKKIYTLDGPGPSLPHREKQYGEFIERAVDETDKYTILYVLNLAATVKKSFFQFRFEEELKDYKERIEQEISQLKRHVERARACVNKNGKVRVVVVVSHVDEVDEKKKEGAEEWVREYMRGLLVDFDLREFIFADLKHDAKSLVTELSKCE